jgi:hypothetical protein
VVSLRVLSWYLAGFAVCISFDAFVAPSVAHAQSTLTNVTPLPQRRIEPQRRAPAPVQNDDDSAPPPPAPPIARTDENGNPIEPDADPQDGEDPTRTDQRRNRDGEPLVGTERQQLDDGTVQTGETEAVRDGQPDTDRDPRSKADVDAFEKPAAGYDAIAFQIEDIDPVLDRRPARLARFEPFDPIGIKRGSWIIFPEVEFGLGATTNIRRSPNKEASGMFDVRPTVRAVTNWAKHAVELKATGFASAFPGFASENDKAYALEARARIDFSTRTNVETLVSHQLDQESRQSRDALDSARGRADFATTRAAAALNHRFNRLSVQLRGSVTDVNYEPVTTVSGGNVSNNQRDVREYGSGVRATYEFKPTLFAFTDVALNDRQYKSAPADNISRDSSGLRVLAGLSFGSGRIWRGEVALGYGTQRPDDNRLTATSGLILDANLGWRISELSSLLFTARTDFNDSTTVGQSGSRAQTFGLEARHAFRRHLIGIASLRTTGTDYGGVSLDERETTAELGFDYFLNRTTTLTGRLTHVDFNTSTASGDYAVDTVRFGVRIRQ